MNKEKEHYKEFYEEVKRLVRNQGRSNIISLSLVDELVVKYFKEEGQ